MAFRANLGGTVKSGVPLDRRAVLEFPALAAL